MLSYMIRFTFLLFFLSSSFGYIIPKLFTSHIFSTEYDPYKYKSKERRLFKKQKGRIDYFEDHHCIPKEFKNHNLI